MKPQGLQVFLSYAERDDKPAHALRTELEKGGFEVWDPAAKLSVLRIDADVERGSRRVLEALKRIQTAA
jgi:hypothetical protein